MSNSKNKLGEERYGKQYLKPSDLKERQCVYISRNVHETIADIVKIIGERGLSIGSYIDTVLQEHLQEHKNEINRLYRKSKSRIIK
jgi:Protein of unknown function (DUF3408).